MSSKKAWFQSKTFWIGVGVIIGGIAQYIEGLPPGVATGTVLIGVIQIVIRYFTAQPIK